MARVVSQISIDGPLERVFDLVTTTRYWPEWHPATLEVGGVTERPLALGDVVRERARLGAHVHEGEWTVVEHVRPRRLVLDIGAGRIAIRYTFAAVGDTTIFRRELEFRPDDFLGGNADPAAVEAFMQQQSDQGLQKLKALVERLLAAPDGEPR
jgi:hypothetical protein